MTKRYVVSVYDDLEHNLCLYKVKANSDMEALYTGIETYLSECPYGYDEEVEEFNLLLDTVLRCKAQIELDNFLRGTEFSVKCIEVE